MSDYILCHHGIKGQKWGVRRFQKKDGSLTPAGKKRYDETNSFGRPPTNKERIDQANRLGRPETTREQIERANRLGKPNNFPKVDLGVSEAIRKQKEFNKKKELKKAQVQRGKELYKAYKERKIMTFGDSLSFEGIEYRRITDDGRMTRLSAQDEKALGKERRKQDMITIGKLMVGSTLATAATTAVITLIPE